MPFTRWTALASSAGRMQLKTGDGKSPSRGRWFGVCSKAITSRFNISNHVHTVIKIGITNLDNPMKYFLFLWLFGR